MRFPLLILSALASLGAAPFPARAELGQRPPPTVDRESGGGGPGPQLFISPSGQPFRVGPGEPYPVAAWFAQADRNKDGAIDAAEFRTDAAAFFKLLDVDGDGVISGAEVMRYETEIVPEISRGMHFSRSDAPVLIVLAQYQQPGSMGGGDMGGGQMSEPPEGGGGDAFPDRNRRPGIPGEGMQGAAPYGLLGQPEPVTSADANFDGRIKLVEFMDAADRRFKLLDADGDGRLTLAELPLTRVQQRGDQSPRPRRRHRS